MSKRISILLLFLGFVLNAPAWTNGFNKPYMGWMSFCYYHHDISATVISNNAFWMTTNGMKAAGYTNVIWDAYWSNGTVDGNGVPVPDATKFPNGLGPVVTYVHSLGLGAGIYFQGFASGTAYPPYSEGIGGHEAAAVNQAATWGYDYIMFDFPHAPTADQLTTVRNAIMACGRPMIFCTDMYPVTAAVPPLVNTCRTTSDPDGWTQALAAMDDFNTQSTYATLGFWPDPSVLQIEVGPTYGGGQTYDLTTNEFKSQFAVWCVMGANLSVSTKLSQITAMSLALLTNSDLIAVNQDALCAVGTRRVHTSGTGGYQDIWSKPLASGGVGVACMNGTSSAATFTISCLTVGAPSIVNVRDLFAHSTLGTYTNSFTTDSVASHSALAFTLLPVTPTTTMNRMQVTSLLVRP